MYIDIIIHTYFKKQKATDVSNTYAENSLMIILIALFFSNFIILSLLQQPVYSQEGTSQTNTNNNQGYEKVFLFIIIIIIGGIVYLIHKEFTKRYGKHRERQYFPASVKEDTIRKQHHKCAICKRGTSVWDFDHKDGNRSNNRPSNCQALCPTCHAKKTRGLLKQKKKFHLSWRVVVGIILFLIFLYLVGVI
jgi:HNH endonuclease